VPQVDAATATVVPSAAPPRRGRGKVVGGLLAAVALLGAGGFAVTKIVSGNDGGAASPSEVGTHLMDALSAEDALGVVDLLLPGERDTLRQPLIDIVDNLKRLEIADQSASLDKVGGLDLQVSNVDVVATETNVPDITNIRILAKGTASVDGKTVPIGNLLIDEAFGGKRPDLDSEAQSSDIDWTLTTVKRGGRWYLSAFYSIAESVRSSTDNDIPPQGLVARGADSPDGAVQSIFDAIVDSDVEALIIALNPNEAESLQRYAPLFLDQAQSGVDDLGADVKISNAKFTVLGDGDRRTVTVDAFTLRASAPDGTDVTVELKDGCTVVTVAGDKQDLCNGVGSIDGLLGQVGLKDNGDIKALTDAVEKAHQDRKPFGITVQKVSGEWFVSPIGTLFDILLTELQSLDKNELTQIIDAGKKVVDDLNSGELFGLGGLGDGGSIDIGGDTGSSTGGGTEPSGFDACFAEIEYDAFSSCVTAGIDDGSIDATTVPPYFRFVDCGVGEAYWNGEVYGMSDADFTDFANQAAPCFQKHVDEGAVTEFELPYELLKPDCLEGKNWYTVDDADYSQRVADCAS